jgi:hypothetical protein
MDSAKISMIRRNTSQLAGLKSEPERQSALQEERAADDVRKCAHDVGVMLELAEATLYVVCVDDQVRVGVGDPQVVEAAVEPLFHVPELAGELDLRGVFCHHVDWDRLRVVLEGGIVDEPVFLSLDDVVVLRGDEEVGDEAPGPAWERDDELVAVLFVHRLQHLAQVLRDGWVVASPPVLQGVLPRDGCVEDAWASHRHHSSVVANEVVRHAMVSQHFRRLFDVSVGADVVAAVKTHQQGNVEVVVAEAGEHCSLVLGLNRRLRRPGVVRRPEPPKVVVTQ